MPTFNWAEAVAGDRIAAAQAIRNADRNADLTMEFETPLSGYSSSLSQSASGGRLYFSISASTRPELPLGVSISRIVARVGAISLGATVEW